MRWLCWILCVAALGYTLVSETMIMLDGDLVPGMILIGLCLLTTLALYCMARGLNARDFGRELSARPRLQMVYSGGLRLGFLILGIFAALVFPVGVIAAVSLIAMIGDFGTSVPAMPWKVFGLFYFAQYFIMPLLSGLAAFCLVRFAIKGRSTPAQKALVSALT